MPTLRDVRDVEAVSSRVPNRWCAVPGCASRTKHAKPYCSQHVLRNPHAGVAAAGLEVVLVLEAMRGRGHCASCGEPVSGMRLSFCSDPCARHAKSERRRKRREAS